MLCLKSPESRLEKVSTTRGSGWVDHRIAILLLILSPPGLTPPTAGGTDLLQVSFLTPRCV